MGEFFAAYERQRAKLSPAHANCIRKIDSRCEISQAVRHQNGMTYLVSFGESGKNFIEIGKRLRVQETMLRLAVP